MHLNEHKTITIFVASGTSVNLILRSVFMFVSPSFSLNHIIICYELKSK